MSPNKNILKLTFILLLSLAGCGDSPFLEDHLEREGDGPVQKLVGDLSFFSSKIGLKLYWRVGPRIGDESKLLILLLTQNDRPLSSDLNLKLKLWMPTMGHGSFPVTVSRLANGVYEASEIFFTMPGLWDVHFQIYRDEKLDEEVKWSLNL